MVKEVCPDAKIVDLYTEQQQNDKDCGAFVVDNLIKMAKGEAILSTEESKNIGTTLRQAHAKTMNLEEVKQKKLVLPDSIRVLRLFAWSRCIAYPTFLYNHY